jgi:hypothetical protein
MSNFYSRFFKVFTLLMGLCANANCATLFDFGFQRVERRPVSGVPAKVESFDWGSNPHTGNLLINSKRGEIAATIFLLQFGEDKGKIGAYLNLPGNKKEEGRFLSVLAAQKWVIIQAQNHGIALARA